MTGEADDGPRFLPIHRALANAADAVGAIPKADQNREQGFAYRGIERVLAAAGPALHGEGITTIPTVLDVTRTQKERGQNRNLWDHVVVTVAYRFLGPAGDDVVATVVAEGLDNADKALSKAMTMAYKVALLQVLGIGDDAHDPDGFTPEAPSQSRGQARTTGTGRKAPAKKAAARKASNGTARRPPTADEQVRPLIDSHGPEHAARVAALIETMNGVEDRASRTAVKTAFAEAFGAPGELGPDRLAEASAWIEEVLSPPDPPPAPRGEGVACETCGADPGGDHVEGCPEAPF